MTAMDQIVSEITKYKQAWKCTPERITLTESQFSEVGLRTHFIGDRGLFMGMELEIGEELSVGPKSRVIV